MMYLHPVLYLYFILSCLTKIFIHFAACLAQIIKLVYKDKMYFIFIRLIFYPTLNCTLLRCFSCIKHIFLQPLSYNFVSKYFLQFYLQQSVIEIKMRQKSYELFYFTTFFKKYLLMLSIYYTPFETISILYYFKVEHNLFQRI